VIVVEATVHAPVAKVWEAYTSPEAIVKWNAASDDWHTTRATVDLQVGGAFSSRMEAKDGSMGFDFEGVYTAVEPERRLAYDFGDRKAEVTFSEQDGHTHVRVAFDPETTHPEDMQRDGWQAILNNFRAFVESQSA